MTELEKLVEKDAIRDQYYVYARALDRIDNPLGKTVFAEDAQVDYGPTYKGTGYGFIDMMLKMHRKMVSTHHVMTNILIKLNEDGTKAAAEAYMYAACKYRNGMVVVARCRDIDLWEKRDGKWLVVKRTVAGDNTMILHPDRARLQQRPRQGQGSVLRLLRDHRVIPPWRRETSHSRTKSATWCSMSSRTSAVRNTRLSSCASSRRSSNASTSTGGAWT